MSFSPKYTLYIQSPQWKARRLKILDFVRHRCQFCGEQSSRLEVHHNNYENLGHEKYSDLVVLCWYCHFMLTWAIRLRRLFRKRNL